MDNSSESPAATPFFSHGWRRRRDARGILVPWTVVPRFDSVPAEIRDRPRWMLWQWEFRDKWTKPPIDINIAAGYRRFEPSPELAAAFQGLGLAIPTRQRTTGTHYGDATDPAKWGTIDRAVKGFHTGGGDGIGFALGDGIAGFDLDHCRNPYTGEITPEAMDVIRRLDTYCEISPSGTGVKGLLFGAKPDRERAKSDFIELYDAGRYFTFTGNPIPGFPLTVNERQGELEAVYRQFFPAATKPTLRVAGPSQTAANLGDDELLRRAFAAKNGADVRRLWEGDGSKYRREDGSINKSAADQALCNALAFWFVTPERIDSMFRKSGLMRGKWDEPRGAETYGRRTVRVALASQTEFYTPGGRHSSKRPRPAPTDAGAGEGDSVDGKDIILAYFRERYRPAFRRGNTVVSEDGTEVPMNIATAVPDSDLIDALGGAADAPEYKGGGTIRDRLPGFFRNWAKVAWGDLVKGLPDEDTADLGAVSPAAEEFRRLVRDALLTQVTLGDVIDRERVTQTERRSLIGWCQKFAKPGRARSIRDYRVYCRIVDKGGGEIELRVGIRHDLFGQVKADRRLIDMGPTRFARLCTKYGVSTSTADGRMCGERAVILHPEFVADMTATFPDGGDDPDRESSTHAHDQIALTSPDCQNVNSPQPVTVAMIMGGQHATGS